jgi:hypothetical protein
MERRTQRSRLEIICALSFCVRWSGFPLDCGSAAWQKMRVKPGVKCLFFKVETRRLNPNEIRHPKPLTTGLARVSTRLSGTSISQRLQAELQIPVPLPLAIC